MKKVSIAMFSSVEGKGGKAARISRLVKSLMEKDALVKVYGTMSPNAPKKNSRFRLTYIPKLVGVFIGRVLIPLGFPKYFAYLYRQYSFGLWARGKIARDRSEVVYCKERPYSIVKAAKSAGKTVVIEFTENHPLTIARRIENSYKEFGIKTGYIFSSKSYINDGLKSIEAADKIIVFSQDTKKNFIKNGVKEQKIALINTGLTEVVPQQSDHAIEGRHFAFISTANHSFVKGTQYLLLAWKEAKIQNAPLILVGSLHDDIVEFIEKYGPFENVLYPGQQNIEEFYQQYNAVGILVSLAEGMPRSVIEYLGYGFPVICSETATCDRVVDGVNGFIVQYNDIVTIKEKLCFFANNPNEVLKMRESVLNFSQPRRMDDYIKDVVQLLEDI